MEHDPEFPGGMKKFYVALSRVIRYPAVARENDIQAKVIVSVFIEKDGSLTDARIIQTVSNKIDNEALRTVVLSPKWQPALINGAAVRARYNIPITFALARR